MKACFIGHRKIEKDERLTTTLKEIIVELIHQGVTAFLFGSMSEFDELAWGMVTMLKSEYPNVKRVYVRAVYPKIDKAYENYLLAYYEESYFPKNIENAGKYSYVERNCEMIDQSTYCIFYYDENYIPSSRRNSGTKIAYAYALKKKKDVINLCK
jgi:uncharacterized phage-like protein YoqJ